MNTLVEVILKVYILVLLILFLYSPEIFPNSFNKNTQLTQVANQIKQLQRKILIDKEHQEGLQQELEKIEITIGALGKQVHILNTSISKEQKKLNQLKTKQQLVLNKLNEQKIALNQQILSTYQLKKIHPLKIILNQSNPNVIQRYLTYYRYLNKSRLLLITSIQESLASLKLTLQEMLKHQRNLKKLLTQKQEQQLQEQEAQNQRQLLLNNFKESMQTKEQQLATLMENQKALYDIISKFQTQQDTYLTSLPFNQLHGKLHWPVAGPKLANFGSLLDVGDQRLNGVIIKANQDTPVRSIYSGKVIFADWLRGFGLLIIINHDNNFMSLYGRNHTLLTHAGSHVRMGDIIATTGNSGGFDKAGLYFEIRKNGTPVDPNIWCR